MLGRQVAIKTLNDGGLGGQHLRTRFLREARAVSALSHVNIATVYDYGETSQGQPYIIMEYVQGQTLADLICKDKLPPERTIEIIIDVARALGEAHRHGIVHRDIKPSNIAINASRQVKVLDFGLAKQLETVPAGNTQTREGVMLGTPMYISPEQAIGASVDARSDLFSLGSVLYECLAGQPAFSGVSPIEICAKVIRDEPAPPSSFNPLVVPDLDRVALKALAKKPDERYQSAELCIEDLRIAAQALKSHTSTQKDLPAIDELKDNESHPRAISNIWVLLKQRHALIARVVLSLVVIAMLALVAWQITRPKPYRLRPEVQALYDQGVKAMHQGAFFRASKNLEQVVNEDKGFALGHARLAEAYVELDDSLKANQHLLRARDLVPNPSILATVDQLKWQAVTDVVNREFDKAIEDYKNLLAVASAEEKPYALTDLGRAYEKSDQSLKAIESYETALTLDPRYAGAMVRLGVLYGRQQRWDQARDMFDKAYGIFDTNSEIEGLAEIGLQRAVIFTQQGKVSEAREQLEKALDRANGLENHDKRIRVLLNLSHNSVIAGKLSEAEKYSSEALALAEQDKMENLTMQGLIDIGNAYLNKGRLVEAETYFNKGLRLAQHYKAGRSEARAYLSLASLKTHQNDPDAARDYFYRALPFYQKGGYRKELAQASVIFGHGQDQMGAYDSALDTFQKQLEIANRTKDLQQLAWAHEGCGVVLNHLQRYSEALNHFQEQYDIVKQLRNNIVLGYAALNIGTMNWQLGNYEAAGTKLDEALQIAEPGNKELQGWVRVSKAQMQLSRLNYKGAIEESQRVLKEAGTGLTHISIQATYTLGLAEIFSGDVATGLRNCEHAVALARKLKDPLPISRALLALAQAKLSAANFREALRDAIEAQTKLSAAGHHESEWRAWLVQAQASHSLGDPRSARELAGRASAVLAGLEQEWGSTNYGTYLQRPDIQMARNQLTKLQQE